MTLLDVKHIKKSNLLGDVCIYCLIRLLTMWSSAGVSVTLCQVVGMFKNFPTDTVHKSYMVYLFCKVSICFNQNVMSLIRFVSSLYFMCPVLDLLSFSIFGDPILQPDY